MPPGSSLRHVVTYEVTFGGSVADFDSDAYQSYLAVTLGIRFDDLSLAVAAASVLVVATVTFASASDADTAAATASALTAQDLTAELGVAVESIAAPSQTTVVLSAPPPRPPPPPPLSPPPSPPAPAQPPYVGLPRSPPETMAGDTVAVISRIVIVTILVVVLLGVCWASVSVWLYFCRKRASTGVAQTSRPNVPIPRTMQPLPARSPRNQMNVPRPANDMLQPAPLPVQDVSSRREDSSAYGEQAAMAQFAAAGQAGAGPKTYLV